jgi:hypothetical protein
VDLWRRVKIGQTLPESVKITWCWGVQKLRKCVSISLLYNELHHLSQLDGGVQLLKSRREFFPAEERKTRRQGMER